MTGSGDGAPLGRGRPTCPLRASLDLLALALWCWSAWLLDQRQLVSPEMQRAVLLCCVLLCCALLWWAASALDPPSLPNQRPTRAPPNCTHSSRPLLQHSQVPKGSALQEAHVQWQHQEAMRASPALLAALLLFAIFPQWYSYHPTPA